MALPITRKVLLLTEPEMVTPSRLRELSNWLARNLAMALVRVGLGKSIPVTFTTTSAR